VKQARAHLLRNASVVISIALAQLALSPHAHAQDANPAPTLAPTPDQTAAPGDAAKREYTGMAIEGWMLYPKVLVGTVFDSNVYQTEFGKKSEAGFRINPDITAELNEGIHKTQLYATGDARIFPSNSHADTIDATIGGTHVWEIERDLVFRAQAEYSRHEDTFNSGVALNGAGTAVVSPQFYNQFLLSASAKKTFGDFFVSLGGVVTRTIYDGGLDPLNNPVPQLLSRDGNVYTVIGRVGYALTPSVYVFLEPSYNWRNFDSSFYDSDGYRVVAGVGTDRVSLFSGELYAGFQQQNFSSAILGNSSGLVAGGKVTWLPTRDLSFVVSVDETLGQSTLSTIGTPFGSAIKTTTAKVAANYEITRGLAASANLSYAYVSYVNDRRRDNDWTAGARLDYQMFRNFGVALQYEYTKVNSNAALASYTRNVVTLAGTYKY
jgi:hypothetical protein